MFANGGRPTIIFLSTGMMETPGKLYVSCKMLHKILADFLLTINPDLGHNSVFTRAGLNHDDWFIKRRLP